MQKLATTILIILFLISCQKKISSTELEQNVFDEIFLKIVDSTYKDRRLYLLFPEKNKGFDDPEYLKKRKTLKKDTIGLVIAISDERKFNLEKFKSQKFVFKELSEIKSKEIDYEKWGKKYSKFAGVMSFSKITFGQNHENGKLTVSYSCGEKCGVGYEVYIKKEKQNWIIIKVERTWIS